MKRFLRKLAAMARLASPETTDVRARVAKPHLHGHGLEFGAGMHPQKLPSGATATIFDKRNAAELEELFRSEVPYDVRPLETVEETFPNGADFLIAHNVLEHIHGEIDALISWHRYVRDGGVVMISVPDKRFTAPDAPRRTADFDHLLLDYALERGEDWLETREHVLSFCLGWADSWSEKSKEEFIQHLLSESNRDGHDCHWHALDREAWDLVVAAAGVLGNTGIEMLELADAESDGRKRTHGEIVYVYRITRGSNEIRGLPDVRPVIAAFQSRLEAGARRLSS